VERLIGGEILLAHVYHDRGDMLAWITPGLSSFKVVGPSSSTRSGGAISGRGCMVP
jgi:hypothetical protein